MTSSLFVSSDEGIFSDDHGAEGSHVPFEPYDITVKRDSLVDPKLDSFLLKQLVFFAFFRRATLHEGHDRLCSAGTYFLNGEVGDIAHFLDLRSSLLRNRQLHCRSGSCRCYQQYKGNSKQYEYPAIFHAPPLPFSGSSKDLPFVSPTDYRMPRSRRILS